MVVNQYVIQALDWDSGSPGLIPGISTVVLCEPCPFAFTFPIWNKRIWASPIVGPTHYIVSEQLTS